MSAEIRDVDPDARHFNPHPRETPLGNLGPVLTIVESKPRTAHDRRRRDAMVVR